MKTEIYLQIFDSAEDIHLALQELHNLSAGNTGV